jgi:hypothetical protein
LPGTLPNVLDMTFSASLTGAGLQPHDRSRAKRQVEKVVALK